MKAVKGIQSVAKTGFKSVPVVGSFVDPIVNLFQRSDQQKLRDWAAEDEVAKRFLTPSQYKKYKAGDQRRLHGGAVDIHKAIGKLPKPQKGWTLPGHNYTGPYNPLEKQVRWDPKTGDILEIYQQPTGIIDAIAMQHDVDYSICKDDKKCKNDADRKMVRALDKVPYNERQWGHWLARNAINTKQKLGLGVPKNGKSR